MSNQWEGFWDTWSANFPLEVRFREATDAMPEGVEFRRAGESIFISKEEFGSLAAQVRAARTAPKAVSDKWGPGSPCGSCGSTDTGYNTVEGGFCRSCHRTDADE